MIVVNGIEYLIKCKSCARAGNNVPRFAYLPDPAAPALDRCPSSSGQVKMTRCDCCGKPFDQWKRLDSGGD